MGKHNEESGWVAVNERVRVLRSRQHLLVSNTGPKNKGFTYCTKCGRVEASTDPPRLIGPHRKPYPDDDDKLMCDGTSPSRHIVLGTDFITDIALLSMRVAAPLKLKPGHSSTVVALRTVSEALAKAACQLLEIEPGELMAEFRPALTPAGISGLEAEAFIYDTLPGGAGFSSQLADRGLELLQLALYLLNTCPENCDASCYRCMRSFKNKFDHNLLDRHVGAELLEYLLNGERPEFSPERLRTSTALLYRDLRRQSTDAAIFGLDVPVTAGGATLIAPILVETGGGQKFIVALSGPLTADHPAEAAVAEFRANGGTIPVIVENELVVRGNLPAATRGVFQKIGAWHA